MSTTSPVSCSACGQAYMLDLAKYGGKKIRCRQCQGIIMVPASAAAASDPEILEDEPTPAALKPQQQGTLHRHRMASQRGAVNIALLQRHEGSREEIRAAFLELHGDDTDRIPDSVIPVLQAKRAAETEQAEQKFDERIKAFQQLIASYAIPDPDRRYKAITGANKLFDDGVEKLYEQAVLLVGGPIVADSSPPPPPVAPTPIPAGGGLFGSLVSKVVSSLDINARLAEFDRQYTQRLPTLKAAVTVLENMRAVVQEKIANANQQYDAIVEGHDKKCRQQLRQAEESFRGEAFEEASAVLEELLKQAPLPVLGRAIATLSKCAFRAGNTAAAARHMQDAICFGASAPVDMDAAFQDLWAKASAGLPKT